MIIHFSFAFFVCHIFVCFLSFSLFTFYSFGALSYFARFDRNLCGPIYTNFNIKFIKNKYCDWLWGCCCLFWLVWPQNSQPHNILRLINDFMLSLCNPYAIHCLLLLSYLFSQQMCVFLCVHYYRVMSV